MAIDSVVLGNFIAWWADNVGTSKHVALQYIGNLGWLSRSDSLCGMDDVNGDLRASPDARGTSMRGDWTIVSTCLRKWHQDESRIGARAAAERWATRVYNELCLCVVSHDVAAELVRPLFQDTGYRLCPKP